MSDYRIYKDLVYQIIGASMLVHQELRYGLAEKIYEESLSIELTDNGIENITQKKLEVFYKGRKLDKEYQADLVAGDVVCELKSASAIIPAHRAQLCNYLRLTKKPVGLLINFGTKSLQCERWGYDDSSNKCYLLDINMNPLSMQNIYIESVDQ